MKHISKHLLIVSTSLSNLPESENKARHEELTRYLNLMSIDYDELTGRFGGTDEWCVVLDGEQVRVAEMILREYEQESYLEHHNDRTCELVFSNGIKTKIGVMREVTEAEALKKPAWTKTKDNRYFVAE